MIKKSLSSENEVVLVFLQAEINSPRFKDRIQGPMTQLELSKETIIDKADLTNEQHNKIRAGLLDFRGYNSRKGLFTGWPEDTEWEHIELEPNEFKNLKYMKYPKFLEISENSRLVINGAKNIEKIEVRENGDSFNRHVREIIAQMNLGKRHPELIAFKSLDGYVILVEGHTRATAHIAAGIKENMKIILGSSPLVNQWLFY